MYISSFLITNRRFAAARVAIALALFLGCVGLLLAGVEAQIGQVEPSRTTLEATSGSRIAGDQLPSSVRPNDSGTSDNRDVLCKSTLESQDQRISQIVQSPILTEFDAWVNEYERSSRGDSEQIKRGEYLAIKRTELLKDLIRLDSKAALERAISIETYNHLPASISEKLERRVSAYGDFLVFAVMSHDMQHGTGEMTSARIEREVVIGGLRYKAFVYGRRETMTTKFDIPLQGIVLDGWMAVDENPLRTLEANEFESHSVELSKLKGQGVVAEVGGSPMYFSNEVELDSFVREQISWEATIGPVRSKNEDQPRSSWTEGPKTVLFIRIDFPDRPGEPLDRGNQPLTTERAQDLINNQVSAFFMNNSYNKTSLTTTVTPVVRMPQPQSFYVDNFDPMITDAENAARGAGFEPNNFNLYIIGMSYNQAFVNGGFGFIGARGAGLYGFFEVGVIAHELGHNYGLYHANLWRTNDGTVIGPGNNVEYGNPFDVMGNWGGLTALGHFNAQYKRRLDWLTDANVQTVTNDGVYRVFAHDLPSSGGIQALKIRKNASKNYWIEFRQSFNTDNAINGAIINWDYLSKNFVETQLLDMTPNTPNSASDAPLLAGQSFDDNEDRIRITVLGKGNTTPESLDIRIEFNVGCTFSLAQTSQSFPAAGGEGSIAVNTPSGCRPPATSNASWLYAVAGDASPVRFIVAANFDSQPRTGTITIGGQTLTVEQAASTTACVPRPSGMVGWWRGEGNALDQTGLNNGTLLNNMTFRGGKVGGGFLGDFSTLSFNTGVVVVPDSSSLALNHSMTFEGWLKVGSYFGTVLERRTAGSPSTRSYEVSIGSGGRLSFIVWYQSVQGSNSPILVSSPDPLPLGQFVHFAASLDDATGQQRMYINGSLVGQFTSTQRPSVISNATINLGNINGITDELSVYNRALSASEIQAIYNAGIAATGATGKCLLAQTPTPTIFVEEGNVNRALALDSVTLLRGPFRILTNFNFSGDRHTRVILFTSELGLSQPDPSKLTVTAGGTSLLVENVGAVTGVSGLVASYIIVRLPDGLSPGDLPLIVTLNGAASSNSPILSISAP